jgi:catechol 2,3-dioxygenase-like lactoylglutathione lyase family enzyme
MTPLARIWKPTLDCADVDGTGAFWCWLLGFEPTFANETTRFLGPPGGRTAFCIQHVDDPRTGKNRMHLDLVVEDLDAVAAEVVAHGGAQQIGPLENEHARWCVMDDPEGNEFCLITLSGS